MKIKIIVKGDSDVKPFIKTFQYEESEEFIFLKSVNIIKDKLAKNLRLNINESLSFFAAFVTTSLKNGKKIDEIKNHVHKLLTPNQVMIGVPESLRELVFSITSNSTQKQVFTVLFPIKINQYFLCEERPIQ